MLVSKAGPRPMFLHVEAQLLQRHLLRRPPALHRTVSAPLSKVSSTAWGLSAFLSRTVGFLHTSEREDWVMQGGLLTLGR